MNNTLLLWAGIAVAIVLAALSFGGHVGTPASGNTTQSFWDAQQGFKVNGTSIINSSGQWIGTIVAAAKATFDAGTLKSYTNSTSTTATTYTLLQADILNYDTMLITPNTNSLTLTLPASSTLTTMIPTAGDRQELCIINGTTTASKTITFTAGTGDDLYTVATSTISGAGGVLPIGPQVMGCFTFARQLDTDVSVFYHPAINAD
jgi:hypothetical protein